MDEEEFNLSVHPTNRSRQFPIEPQSEFIVTLHADVTLLTDSSDGDEDTPDYERSTTERFIYDKDVKMGRQDFQNKMHECRDMLVNALTEMETLPDQYYNKILNGIFEVVKGDEFDQCNGVLVDIELARYEYEEDSSEMEDEEVVGGMEPSFVMVMVDEGMKKTEGCVICLGEFEVGVGVYRLNCCQHFFHCKCLLDWLENSVTCPLCRKKPPSFFAAPLPAL